MMMSSYMQSDEVNDDECMYKSDDVNDNELLYERMHLLSRMFTYS